MVHNIKTQSDLIYSLCSEIEQAEKFNHNLEQAQIKLKRAKLNYIDLPTQENASRLNALASEINGVNPVDIELLNYKLTELVKNN